MHYWFSFSLLDEASSWIAVCFGVLFSEVRYDEAEGEIVSVVPPSLEGFRVGCGVTCEVPGSVGCLEWVRGFPQYGHFSSFGSTLLRHFEQMTLRLLVRKRNARRRPRSTVMRAAAISQYIDGSGGCCDGGGLVGGRFDGCAGPEMDVRLMLIVFEA